MSAEHDTRSGYVGRGVGWPIGGAVGGVLGAAAFGVVLWLSDPETVSASIPAIYGLEPAGITGWAIHIATGAVLGIIFAFLATRPTVLGVLAADVETAALSRTGLIARITGAGLAYGIAIWAILPVLALPVLTELLETGGADGFPTVAVEGLVGHALFGIVLGLVVALTIDLSDRDSVDVLAE